MVTTYNSTALKAYKPPLARQAANYLHQYPNLSRNYPKTCVDQTAIQSYLSAQKNSNPAVVQQALGKTLHDIILLCVVEN